MPKNEFADKLTTEAPVNPLAVQNTPQDSHMAQVVQKLAAPTKPTTRQTQDQHITKLFNTKSKLFKSFSERDTGGQ